jgi:hypothetical protein
MGQTEISLKVFLTVKKFQEELLIFFEWKLLWFLRFPRKEAELLPHDRVVLG